MGVKEGPFCRVCVGPTVVRGVLYTIGRETRRHKRAGHRASVSISKAAPALPCNWAGTRAAGILQLSAPMQCNPGSNHIELALDRQLLFRNIPGTPPKMTDQGEHSPADPLAKDSAGRLHLPSFSINLHSTFRPLHDKT